MAVLFQWSGDGLNPGTLTTTSAGTGDTAPSQISLVSGATASIVTTGSRTPAIQLHETSLGASAVVDWKFESSPTVSLRLYFTPTGTLATTHAIFSLRGVAKVRVADIILTSAGAVRVYDIDNAYQSVGANGTIVPGSTYRFEITLNTETNALNFALFPEHSTSPIAAQNNVPGNFSTAGIEYIRIGKNTASQQAEVQVWDDLTATTSESFLGPAVTVTSISAGPAQTQVEPFSTITLTGSVISGTVTSWLWTQTSGMPVTLNGSGATRTFTAPASPEAQLLEFQATGDGAATASTSVSVNPHLDWIKTDSGLKALRPGEHL